MIGTVKLYKPYMNSRKRMVKAMAKIAKQLTELIGNTPLLELTNYEKENDIKRLISFMVISILAFCVKSVIEK